MGKHSGSRTSIKALVLRAKEVATDVRLWFALNAILFSIVICLHFFTGFPNRTWWNDAYSLLTNLLIGGIVSFLFYYLVVVVPDNRKKSIIKNNLKHVYRSIKIDLLWQIVFASQKGGRRDLETSSQFVERLLDVDEFRKTFEGGRKSEEGFYAFQNQMTAQTPEFRDILINLERLQKQTEFLLHNYSIDDQDVFDFFKRLDLFLLGARHMQPGYDESKALCGFLWEICAGWSFVDGYRGHDTIEKFIGDI